MNEDNLNSNYSQMYSGINFTSQFFGNFIDNSHISSNASQSSIIAPSEQNNNQEYSINEQKMRQFHMQNLCFLAQTIAKRVTLHKWQKEKNRLKKMQEMTPQHTTMVILKVFYLLSVKLQVKYSFAFRKLQRFYNESKEKSNIQIQSRENINQKNSKVVLESPSKNKQEEKTQRMMKGIQKLVPFVHNLQAQTSLRDQLKWAFNFLYKRSRRMSSISLFQTIFEQVSLEILFSGWSSIISWIKFTEKISILQGTINLLAHPKMREALWAIGIQKQSLDCNDISNIHQSKSRKESFKMNVSTESMALQKELIDNIPIIDFKSENQQEKDFRRSPRKKDGEIDRNDPKFLKFSKDVKRKTAPSMTVNQSQQEDFQNQSIHQQNFQETVTIAYQVSQMKPPNQDLSLLRRNSATMNTSIYQSKSILKRVLYPIEFTPASSYRVVTKLNDDNLPQILNEGRGNKQFQNNSRLFKTKGIKHEQLRKEFTDFNDLFSVREILYFYQSVKVTEESRKGISLAKIKEKYSIKTTEEYYSKLYTDPNHEYHTERVLPSSNNLENSRSLRKNNLEHTLNSIKSNNSKSRSRKSSRDLSRRQDNLRKPQFRIPSELPKNFDYYVDKSVRNEARIQKATSADLRLSTLGGGSRVRSGSKSKKKIQFKVVKQGASVYQSQRKRPGLSEIEPIGKIMISIKPKVEIPNPKKSKQKQMKEKESCEYFMTFRSPPKKKIKKGILKTDV